MPMLDISKVSETLKTLVKNHVEASLEALDPGGTTNSIGTSLDPPDQVNGNGKGNSNGNGSDTISLYLYHLTENSHYKNLPAPGRDQPPIRYTPMGLNLFYQVTAHAGTATREQTLMGLAVKALRDYPVIDDITDPDGLILEGDLQDGDNHIRIELQPIPHNEAVSYWSAGSSPLRLAAYYQVSIALLEPEETQTRTGRVLSYGVHAFVSGSPRLDYSTNTLFFPYPGETEDRQIELRPAQVPFESDTPPPPGDEDKPRNGDVAFVGSDLSGDRTSLLLNNARWDDAVEVDDEWDVAITDSRATARVQKAIVLPPDPSGVTPDPIVVLPGPYGAVVRKIMRRTLSDGSVREFEHSSNQTPFLVTPRIDGLSGAGIADRTQAVDVAGWIFEYTDPKDADYELDIQIYLGSFRLVRNETPPLGVSEFSVVDQETLRFVRPTEIQDERGREFSLRIFVNGAESAPRWLGTPS